MLKNILGFVKALEKKYGSKIWEHFCVIITNWSIARLAKKNRSKKGITLTEEELSE